MIRAVDLYCGAGGTSSGLVAACEALGLKLDLVAVNHWEIAIETHSANHPDARHYCASVDSLDPRKVVPSGRLNLMIASPECTHHSIARGGRPIKEQYRVSAWHVLRWAEILYVENILIENVREFRNWGPLDARGRPLKRRKGETYQAFLAALRSLGYTVEDRILNAADYGDATTRERLFIMARKGRRPIQWPEPSHAPARDGELFESGLQPWRPAREIIDWTLPGQSIFERKRPLKPSTIARIAAGLEKFGGEWAGPFLVMLYGTGNVRSLDRPLPTVTAKGQHIGLCQPFIVPFFGERDGQKPRVHSVKEPLPTVTGHGAGALVEPFLLQQQSGGAPRAVSNPVPTIATKGAIALVEPFLVKFYGAAKKVARPVTVPLDTVTTKDRFGLVRPEVGDDYRLDIRFRMLQPPSAGHSCRR